MLVQVLCIQQVMAEFRHCARGKCRLSVLLVIFTPISELRDFIVRRLSKQNRQIEEGPGGVRFAVAVNELAGYPRVSQNSPDAQPASFQGRRSYIPLACEATF
jgi:hypothetical protein